MFACLIFAVPAAESLARIRLKKPRLHHGTRALQAATRRDVAREWVKWNESGPNLHQMTRGQRRVQRGKQSIESAVIYFDVQR